MTTQPSLLSKTVLLVGVFLSVFFFVIIVASPRAHAQVTSTANAAAIANAMCTPDRDYSRACGTPPDQFHPLIGGLNCPCGVAVNNIGNTGICTSVLHCQAISAGGSGVDSGLSQLGQILSQALQQLLKSASGGDSGSGGGSGSGGSTLGTTATQSCTTYYQVSTPSSDPCAYYVPTINSPSTSTASDLLNALNIGGGGTIITTGPSTGTTTTISATTSATIQVNNSVVNLISNPRNLNLSTTSSTTNVPGADSFSAFSSIRSLVPGPNPNQSTGPQGDVVLTSNGATVSASNQNIQNNTAVSGFFGADTFATVQAQGIGGWLCQRRPWANSFLSKLIPDTFFDGLCTWRGYQAGVQQRQVSQQQTSAPVLTQTVVHTKAATTTAKTGKPVATTTSSVPTVPPKVQIWAVPAAVRVGSRTSVFWSTQGVSNCTETSPDGSFNQTSLSGGASTVPLTTATTYSISCLAPDGTPASAYFTVNISN